MFFPWVGFFEQVRIADVFVFYDDVQLPLGRSFISRVQVKTQDGSRWLTVPVIRHGKQLIRDVLIDNTQDWRRKHLATLRHSYARAPHLDEMLSIVEGVYAIETDSLCALNMAVIEEISRYLDLDTRFVSSSIFRTESESTQKLADILERMEATRYVTGTGALNYLDHELLERGGVATEYMDYQRLPYQQLHGAFTASVSVLDCIANCGRACADYVQPVTVPWRELVHD